MAAAEDYARWIVNNSDKRGTPEFETVVSAYQAAKSVAPPKNDSPGIVAGALTSSGNASALGYADEISGKIQSMLPFPYGTGGSRWDEGAPASDAENYAVARDSAREKQKAFSDKHPVIDFGASMVGGISGPGGLLGAAAKTGKGAQVLNQFNRAGPGARYVAGMGAGGTGGAIAGHGYGETGGDAVEGGLLGLGMAAVVPPLASSAKYLGDKVYRAGTSALDLMRSPKSRFYRKAAQAAERDGLSPAEISRRMQEIGPEAMPIDVSPNLLGMGEAYAQVPGRARTAATEALDARQKGAQGRIVKDLFDQFGVKDVDIDSATMALHGNMRQIGQGYAPLMEKTVDVTPKLNSLMKRPTIQRGLREAANIAADEGDEAFAKYLDIDPKTKEFVWKEKPTLKAIDYVKRGLDDVIDSNTDAITGKMAPEGKRANDLKRALLSEVDDKIPDYAKIRNAYADEKAAESAMNAGRRFMRADAETTARKMSEFSDAEKAFYKIGAARHLRDTVMRRMEEFKQWRASPLDREKITAVMGKAEGEKFIKRLETESAFSATKNSVLAGSPTQRRAAAMDEAAQDPGGLIDAARSPTNAILGLLQRDARKVPDGMLEAGADWLYTPQSNTGLLGRQLPQGRGLPGISPGQLYGGLLATTPVLSGMGAR